ncbi:hypothetical protein [Streptomyces sp. NPDC057939]|uniref:hypothetical protein n=1 Tax=Streptomyces sp. NPDC057939 TaxID=3346284 RepID=UPI0036EF3B6F
MGDWRTDPTFAMCRELVDGADPASFVGGAFDVRAVVTATIAMQPGDRRGSCLDAVPWGNFPHGEEVHEDVRRLHTGEGPAGRATAGLWGLCANDSRAAVALAVPFLIPIATDADHPHRAPALSLLSGPARARHHGVASRDGLLLHRTDPRRHAPGDYDDYGVEVTGYPAGWSVAAARAAITAEAPALLPFLHDPDPTIRIDATYVLATAADPDHTVRTALATRFSAEQEALVRAALLFAVAETTRAHAHSPTASWLRERWQDRREAPEVRLAAAIGWLCLTDEPVPVPGLVPAPVPVPVLVLVPEDLRRTVDAFATDERAHAMEALPWMEAAGGSGEPGLLRCVRCMLHPEEPEPSEDPWASWP